MQAPSGVVTRHDDALPTDVYPVGQVESATTIADSTIVTNPTGHVVDGAAACATPTIIITHANITKRIIKSPISMLIPQS